MIISKIMKSVMSFIIDKKTRSNLIWNISTKSQKVVSLIRLSTSLSLGRALGNRYSCVMWLVPSYCKAGMFSISHLKWRKSELQSELMRTFSMSRFNNWLTYRAKCLKTKSQVYLKRRKELL